MRGSYRLRPGGNHRNQGAKGPEAVPYTHHEELMMRNGTASVPFNNDAQMYQKLATLSRGQHVPYLFLLTYSRRGLRPRTGISPKKSDNRAKNPPITPPNNPFSTTSGRANQRDGSGVSMTFA